MPHDQIFTSCSLSVPINFVVLSSQFQVVGSSEFLQMFLVNSWLVQALLAGKSSFWTWRTSDWDQMLSTLAENNNQHSSCKKAGSFLYLLSVQMENEPKYLQFYINLTFFIGTYIKERWRTLKTLINISCLMPFTSTYKCNMCCLSFYWELSIFKLAEESVTPFPFLHLYSTSL